MKHAGKKEKKQPPRLHETFMDQNIAGDGFSVEHGEGRLRNPVAPLQMYILVFLFVTAMCVLTTRVFYLQIAAGAEYRDISENNTFTEVLVLPVRGDIYDRNGEKLAWNEGDVSDEVPMRKYREPGFSALLGFIRYPQKDTAGTYFRSRTDGVGGVEERYDPVLTGSAGSFVLEKNAVGETVSERYIEEPVNGEDVTVSVDSRVQRHLFESIRDTVSARGFRAGAGVLLDARSGEIIAMVSYPEFNNNAYTDYSKETPAVPEDGADNAVFVHRAISGLYTPGSTVKPFFAVAALQEGVVSPETVIVSTGSITIKNPYDPSIVYVYKDWKAHGPLNIYGALAHSSNVYFYYAGGGYREYTGLGIDRLKRYANLFGFGIPTAIGVFHEPTGTVPGREWKRNIHGENWLLGDTYNTVIGQYAFQTTPLQLARATAVLVNGGYLVRPHFNRGMAGERTRTAVSDEALAIVREGMRRTVTEGTAKILNTPAYAPAAKTGSAQLGRDDTIHSLLIGFFPYDNPKYVFSIVLEHGKGEAATAAAKLFFDRLALYTPEYL